MLVSMIDSSLASRLRRTAALAVLVFFAASQAQAAAKLDKETCEQLKTEQAKFAASGIVADFERGPEWAKTNLAPERLREIEHYIILEEQLKFGCRMAEVSLDAARAAEEANELEGLTPAKGKKTTKQKSDDKKPAVTNPAARKTDEKQTEEKKFEDNKIEDRKSAKKDKGAAAPVVPHIPQVQSSETPSSKSPAPKTPAPKTPAPMTASPQAWTAKTEAVEAHSPVVASPEPAVAPPPGRRSPTDHMNRALSTKIVIPGGAKPADAQMQLTDE